MFINFLGFINALNYSILCDTSKNYHNYRHFVNIQVFYQKLLQNNFQDKEIVTLFIEDPFSDPRFGKEIPFKDDSVIEKHFDKFSIIGKYIFNMPEPKLNNGNSLKNAIICNFINSNNKKGIRNLIGPKEIILGKNRNIPYMKLHPSKLNLDILLNILHLRHEKLYRLNENDNLMIYLTGHGNSDYFIICNRYFLMKDDIMNFLEYLSKRINKVLLILDTCQAEAMISKEEIPENVTVVVTSGEKEYSWSSFVSSEIGVSTIDDFGERLLSKTISSLTIKEFFSVEHFGELKSKILVFGNVNENIMEFFHQSTIKNNLIKPF